MWVQSHGPAEADAVEVRLGFVAGGRVLVLEEDKGRMGGGGTWDRRGTCRFGSRVSLSMAGRRVGRRVPGGGC